MTLREGLCVNYNPTAMFVPFFHFLRSLVSTRGMKKERECFYHQKHLINFRLFSLKQLPFIFIFFLSSKNCKNTTAAKGKKKKPTKTKVYKKYWHLINRLQQQHHSDTICSILTRIPHDNSTSSDWAIITSHITASNPGEYLIQTNIIHKIGNPKILQI